MTAENTCSGCGRAHHQVRILVALKASIFICNECIDICSEIAHVDDGGCVQIGAVELEQLRNDAHQAMMARIWINGVREAINRADEYLPKAKE